MHSPIHPDTDLQLKEIEPGLSVYLCPKSGGVWIPLQNYLAWKEHHKMDKARCRPDTRRRSPMTPNGHPLSVRSPAI